MRRKRTLRIFIVDHDSVFVAALQQQIRLAFGPRAVVDGFSAEEDCYAFDGKAPAVVLLGLQKGHAASDGLKAVERLKKNFRCKVILLPSDGDGDTIRTARLHGISDCVVKGGMAARTVIEKLVPLSRGRLRFTDSQRAVHLPGMFSPTALLAILLTVLLGCWMFFSFV